MIKTALIVPAITPEQLASATADQLAEWFPNLPRALALILEAVADAAQEAA